MKPWVRPVAAIGATTVVVVVAMIVSGMGPNVPLVVVLVALLGVAAWALTEIAGATPAAAPVDSGLRPPPPNRAERRVTRLRTGLAYSVPNGLVFEQLHESLVSVIDDQLRAAHQIDRTTDPSGAHAVIGDELQTFIDDPASAAERLARPRALDRILALIEQL